MSASPLRILVLLLAFAPSATAETLVEGIAAQVGNDIILASEVLEISAPVEERMRQAGAPAAEVALVRGQALDRLIEGRLLSSVVERLELSAGREEVDNAIAAIADGNGLTVDQLLDSIASHGLSVEEYRSKIQDEIERSKVVGAMVRSRVKVTDAEVRAAYDERFGNQRSGGEEIHLRHILVMTKEEGPTKRSAAEACAIANEGLVELDAQRTSFEMLAQQISDQNPETGGDLGWIHRDDLAAWMSTTVIDLEPGDISVVVEMPFGCNILQVVDRREFTPIDFETAAPELSNMIYQQKTEVEYTKWLDVLRGQTYIERKGVFAASNRLGG